MSIHRILLAIAVAGVPSMLSAGETAGGAYKVALPITSYARLEVEIADRLSRAVEKVSVEASSAELEGKAVLPRKRIHERAFLVSIHPFVPFTHPDSGQFCELKDGVLAVTTDDFRFVVDPKDWVCVERVVEILAADIRQDPNDHLALILHGTFESRLDNFQAASRDFAKLIELDENQPLYRVFRACERLATGEIRGGIEELSLAIKATPKEPELWNLRGQVYRANNQSDLAISDFDECLRLAPNDEIWRGALFARAELFEENGRFVEALRDVDDLIRRDENDVELRISRARILRAQHKLQEAIDEYNRILQIDGNLVARVLPQRGATHQQAGEHAEALADFSQLVALNPQNRDALIYRARIHEELGDLDLARTDLTAAVALNNRDAVPVSELLRIVKQLGDEAVVTQYYEMAEKVEAESEWEFLFRGAARFRMGNLDGALSDFTQAIDLNPQVADYFRKRAYCYWEKGAIGAAIVEMDRAIILEPKNSEFIAVRGALWGARLDTAKALADLDAAIQLDSANYYAYSIRAAVHEKLGSFFIAIRDYRSALRIDPTYPEAIRGMVWLLSTCPNKDIRNGPQALSLGKWHMDRLPAPQADDHRVLAAAFAEVGEFADAVAYQQKAVELSPEAYREQERALLRLYETKTPYRMAVMPPTN